MIYERLILMRDLLAEDGSIYVHCDPRVNASMRNCCDEVFARERFINERVWKRSDAHNDAGQDADFCGKIHDIIYTFYGKNGNYFGMCFLALCLQQQSKSGIAMLKRKLADGTTRLI
jgi:adenine specific DNA methylase Mod